MEMLKMVFATHARPFLFYDLRGRWNQAKITDLSSLPIFTFDKRMSDV